MKILFPDDCMWTDSKKKIVANLIEKRINLLIGRYKASKIASLAFCASQSQKALLGIDQTKHGLFYTILLSPSYLYNIIEFGDGRKNFDATICDLGLDIN